MHNILSQKNDDYHLNKKLYSNGRFVLNIKQGSKTIIISHLWRQVFVTKKYGYGSSQNIFVFFVVKNPQPTLKKICDSDSKEQETSD